MSKIYLGRVKPSYHCSVADENLYIEKHKWDCGWYWGFGYIGNKNLHTHFDIFLKDSKYASEIFQTTNISDDDWWVIRDLFTQAYALKNAAEVYRYGGHNTSMVGVTDIIKDESMCVRLNADLEKILNKVWEFMVQSTSK